MTNYEHMIVSAIRYALGRMTYIVSLTVNYVLEDIKENKLSSTCLELMLKDIQSAEYLGMECDVKEWEKLSKEINKKLRS